MTAIEKPEKLNERKKHYQIIDDDMLIRLKEYYKLEDHGELLKFVKEHCMKGDIILE
ncbi:hypothetical protein [Nitrososphaera viennensis]|uniref:Uncharacterized protein n=2 Tax=Nitrososphaera viennensis TaxID=1034015 RepID=A0A060HK27_9ARCH|nr:hypothetical protein [Nitrososphaera viennensis]AIC16889.1 hypothetical protein NVIE_026200 [Nitrososphaera viennensis EN76]UVS68794.1 hypothetical protein NWT39_12915 [Nitrososphaera viennensis]